MVPSSTLLIWLWEQPVARPRSSWESPNWMRNALTSSLVIESDIVVHHRGKSYDDHDNILEEEILQAVSSRHTSRHWQ